MKRVDLLRHLRAQGCQLLREGANHTIYVNRVAGKTSSVPRHREINGLLVRKISHDLEVSEPGG